MPIPFTAREMQKAWRDNKSAADKNPRTNAHRLLLFYAVECGLKAILMKRQSKNCTDECEEIWQAKHNINKLLDCLATGAYLRLPSQLIMKPIRRNKSQNEQRKLTPGEINQMWRYGGCSTEINDEEVEKKLAQIADWIEGELKRP